MPTLTVPAPPAPRLKLDLGLRQLLPEWRGLVSGQYLKQDVLAGLNVAAIAIPLSLAIALASGVAPEVGLVTAIVAGIVCALFGGMSLTVSGPAAAMSVLVASTVQQHGLGGLLFIGLVVGALQVLTGVLGLGRFIRYIPVPVVSGLLAGIGAILFIGQLPRIFGLPSPDQSHVVDVLTHLGPLWHQAQPAAVVLAVTALGLILGLTRVAPRLPACLLGAALPTLLPAVFNLPVATLGELSGSLPLPRFPSLAGGELGALLGSALSVYVLASLQALMSSSSMDKLVKGMRHDPDQEFIGQGLGNVAVSVFGGIPITAAVLRSSLNARTGARTRRSAILQALVLLGSVYLLAPVLSRIPLAALAGVLLSVAVRMLHPRVLLGLWRTSRSEGLVYLVTFLTVVAVDLAMGVQAGLLAALGIAAIRLGQTKTGLLLHESPGPYRFVLSGPLTFLSSSKLESLRAQVGSLDPKRGVVIDLCNVTAVDASGAEMFIGLVENLEDVGARVALQDLRSDLQQVLLRQEHGERLRPLFALAESDVTTVLHSKPSLSALGRLLHGVERFRQEQRKRYSALFLRLANGQRPHTVFITCSDSRINPNLLTSTEPGELFIVRNVGNLVPPAGSPMSSSVGSALEYAVGVLGATEVVVCGHSGCGAMKALLSGAVPEDMPSVSRWLEEANPTRAQLSSSSTPEHAAQVNARLQVRNVLTYPLLRRKVEAGEVRLHVWFYDVSTSDILEWDEASGQYAPLGQRSPEEQAQHSLADKEPLPQPG